MVFENLDFSSLPDLPQCLFLQTVAANLWAREDVVALWIGGSLGRGEGDAYSDVDLRVAVLPEAIEQWRKLDPSPFFAHQDVMQWLLTFDSETFLHHTLLQSGELYDLLVQSTAKTPHAEPILVLGCRDATFGAILAERVLGKEGGETAVYDHPVDPDELQRYLKMFWVNAHKGQKVIARELHITTWLGVNQILRPALVRLTYILATGRDCGDLRRVTIHSLTPIVRHVQGYAGGDVVRLLGGPLRSLDEIMQANDELHTAVSQAGRQVAKRFGFDYPDEVEAVVLSSWAKFKVEMG
ncbi:MAG: hypothetical protein AAF614_14070 [Chloroflexota bacterium]